MLFLKYSSIRAHAGANLQIQRTRCYASVSASHWSLKSFFQYAENQQLSPQSTYYVGTLYEYVTLEALRSAARMSLERCGGTGDEGVDLRGEMRIANGSKIPVIVQCKSESKKPGVRHIRELEGACANSSQDTLAMLAAKWPITAAAQRTLLSSPRPMSFCLVTDYEEGGYIRQLVWNGAAQKILKGLSVVQVSQTSRNSASRHSTDVRPIALVSTLD
ncbi:uncharacterized protein V2V93DRAFT_376395 [Kockiozyma suomiensis]|uniref:uncharacterized protein n=1 Tax=Kockiozyma suomiensis TaxID=1337062 RepID=UPI003343A2FB